MERYLVIYFINVCVLLWLGEIALRRSFRSLPEWAARIGPGAVVLTAVCLDAFRSGTDGRMFLLASDILFFNAVFLGSVSIMPSKARMSLLPGILSVVCLGRSVLSATGLSLPVAEPLFMTLTASVLLGVGAFFDASALLSHPKEIIHAGKYLFPMKVVHSQAAGTAAMLLAVLGYGGFRFSRAAMMALSVILSLQFLFLYVSTSVGRNVLRQPIVPMVFKREAVVLDQNDRMDLLFQRVENYMRQARPYLDDNFTLTGLAAEMMTNKGMLSKTINDKSGMNFCKYVNNYRIRYAVSLMQKDRRLKVAELSLMSGFHSVASFNMAFKLFMNDTPSEYMRTLHTRESMHQEDSG